MIRYLNKFIFISAILVLLVTTITNAYAGKTQAPRFTRQPTDVTVTAPATATFTVAASGSPAPTYQWKQQDPGASTYAVISGATSATYTTPATTTSMSGTKYICVATNSLGSATSNAATLTVNVASVAPTITTQPVSVTVPAPSSATFTVVASGVPAPTYQWQQEAPGARKYTAISGATAASYITPATTTAMSGTQYRCIVSNSAGSVISNAATLTVTQLAPVISITSPENNSTLTAGSSMIITVSASEPNGSISSVDFFNDGKFIGSKMTYPYTFVIPNASVGNYSLTAKATDANGNSATSSPVTVTVQGTPEVNIASPSNQSTFTTGSIEITAIATENYGTIKNVAFYNGTTLLGNVASTSQAFTYSWANIPSGTYNLTAVATDPLGATVTSSPVTFIINSSPFTYAVDDNIATKTDVLNHTTSYEYDNLNRLLKTIFADGSVVSYVYDAFGNQISVTDQRGNILTKTYDAYERLFQTKDPNGGITQFDYDTEGHLLILTDANGHTTTYTYNPNGKVLTQTNALNYTTTFTYDPVGNIATRQDANGKTTTYTYDALNRLTNTVYPDGNSVANVYDALSRRTSMTDATGQTAYTYDALNRLLTKTSPGTNSTITYTYDSEGNRLTSVDQNNRTITNTFDALNRLASVTDPNGTTLYGYDAVSNKISVTSPNGVVESYTYDPLNRVLTAVNQNGAGVISSYSNEYDIAGMIKKKTFSDGSWTTYIYDALNQLLSETKQIDSSVIYSNVYTYDLAGNRLTWTKNTTLGTFWSVDYLKIPSSVLAAMTNAGYGNTANPALTISLAINYTNDAANRLTDWSETISVVSSVFPVQASYTYDNNGNRIGKVVSGGQGDTTAQQTSYAYDFENRLNQLTYINIPNIAGTQTDNLIYNGEGLRVQALINNDTANYLYDGLNILVERDSSGNTTKTYTRGIGFPGGIGGLIAQNYNAIVQYYDYNDLGSVSDLTTSTGTTANSYSYDAFGNLLTPQTSGDTNRYLFSTKEFESRSGLYYFGERYYDPEVGRWLTPDPLGMVDGPNLYVYLNNNPLNFVDPWGLSGERAGSDWDFSDFINWLDDFSTAMMMNPVADGMPQIPLDQGLGLIGLGVTKGARGITTFWQYSTKGATGKFLSKWFVKGKGLKPPYKLGREARKALNLPKGNKATAVKPYYPESIVGPRHPKPKPEWGWPKKGKGREYYDGTTFPD